jgi:hypothetical protein
MKPRRRVSRSGSDVAEMTTGTVISSEKGLVSPPVMKSRPPSCSASKVRMASAGSGDRRCVDGKRKERNRLSSAESAMSAKQSATGTGNSSTKATNSTAALWPAIASHRSQISVLSRAG